MKNKVISRLIILLLLIAVLAGGYFFLLSDKPLSDSENSGTELIEIPMGSSTGDIGRILVENKIIDSEFKFKLFSRINKFDGKYVAGAYNLSPAMTKKEICEILISGKSNETTITVPEGYTVDDIAVSMTELGYDGELFKTTVRTADFPDFDFLVNIASTKYRLEGYLFPATYNLPTATDDESAEYQIIYSMLEGFDNVFTEEYKARAKELGYSIHEIITIASIIEKEAIKDEDRAYVASVIYNRLDTGMNLGMDTTILYVLDEHKVDLTYDDIAIDSPYNTYKYPGLPPGPICNPGEASIRAALYPAESNYYYFVVSDAMDGSIKFSETYEEFEVDVDNYYTTRDEVETDEENDNEG